MSSINFDYENIDYELIYNFMIQEVQKTTIDDDDIIKRPFCSICSPNGMVMKLINLDCVRIHLCNQCIRRRYRECSKCKKKINIYDFKVYRSPNYPLFIFSKVCEKCFDQ